MKKLLFSCLLLLAAAGLTAQITNPRDYVRDTFTKRVPNIEIYKPTCACENNIVRDGGFATVTTNPGSTNISTTSPIWKPQLLSPQWDKTAGCCDSGFVAMWGNKVVGESVRQFNVPFVTGRTYKISYCAKFKPSAANTLAIFRFSVSSGRIDPLTTVTSTAWNTYSFTWTANVNSSWLDIAVENNHAVDNGELVSWGHIDNVCIQDITCNCGSWRPVVFSNLETKKSVNCGQTLVVKQGLSWSINPSFACNGGCAAKITGVLTSPSGQVITMNSFPFPFKPTELGFYKLTLNATCGDKRCAPCEVMIFSSPGCPGDVINNPVQPK